MFRFWNKHTTLYGGEAESRRYNAMTWQQKVVYRITEVVPLRVLGGWAMAIIFVFILNDGPSIQATFNTRSVDAKYGVYLWLWGVMIFLLADLRKAAIQAWPKGWFARVAW